MSAGRPRVTLDSPDDWREQGLLLATRLFGVLRTARSYPLGNPVLATQLEQMLDVLEPVLAGRGEVTLVDDGGDLHLNDTALPLRANTQRFLDLVVQELRMREIAGLRFGEGLGLEELSAFMQFFLASASYKGRELEHACAERGIVKVRPVLHGAPAVVEEFEESATGEAPARYVNGLDAWDRAVHDGRVLLGGPSRGIEARHLKRVVLPLVDAAVAGDALSAGLGDAGYQRTRGWLFGLRTALVAVSMGRYLGLGREALVDIGVVGLLQDGADGRARGPAGSFAHLAHLAPLAPATLAAMRLAVEPAETTAGGAGGGTRDATPLADLVRLAALYVTLESERSGEQPRLTPGEALGLVLGPLSAPFPPALRAALVRALGCFPPGQVVELDDGAQAHVCAAHPDDPERPIVEMLRETGDAPPVPAACELPAGRSVVLALPLDRWPRRLRRRRAA